MDSRFCRIKTGSMARYLESIQCSQERKEKRKMKTALMTLLFALFGTAAMAQTHFSDPLLELRLHPNPTAHYVEVSLQAPAGAVQLEIFNLLGHRVMPGTTLRSDGRSFSVPLEVRQLPAGIYLVRISQGNHTAVRRLTVQH
jgi:hypothetical protein